MFMMLIFSKTIRFDKVMELLKEELKSVEKEKILKNRDHVMFFLLHYITGKILWAYKKRKSHKLFLIPLLHFTKIS